MPNVDEDSTCCENTLKPLLNPAISPWVAKWHPLVKSDAHVLDVAAGKGRHGRFFLDHGSNVTFVDKTTDGLSDLLAHNKATIVTQDLETGHPWPFDDEAFDAVVVVNYLHRPVFKNLLASLKPEGVLIYETFGHGNAAYGRPKNPDFLLQPGELLDLTKGTVQVVAYEHGLVDHQGSLSVKQSLCAVKEPNPRIPRRS